MGIIATVVTGAIAGAIAKFVMPGKNEPKGFLWTIAIGILGAMLFTFLGRRFGIYDVSETAGIIGAIVGAIILLLGYAAVKRNR